MVLQRERERQRSDVTSLDSPGAIAMAAVFPKDSCWQYKCPFRKTWVDVSKEEDRQLKEAYRSLPKGAWNWIVRL